MREKSHRRVFMMLRGGAAPFQIETGRWKGVPREERMCRECRTNVEGITAMIGCYVVQGGIQKDDIL